MTFELTLAVGKANSQSLSLGLTLADIGGGIPDPAAVTANVGAQLHVRDDYRISISNRSFDDNKDEICIYVGEVVL